MPFRSRFDCLWCGQPWEVRAGDDLEGWAALCPECLGKADDNGFLRARLRAGLRERAASTSPEPSPIAEPAGPAPSATSPEPGATSAEPPGDWEDWYLRRAGFSRGPVYDGPWTMELEQVTSWVDAQPLSGEIVELGAGMGWWTGLLAGKGELWVYDDDDASLEAARKRLMAHGLLAHLHLRQPLAPPDRPVDAVFAAYLLAGAGPADALGARIAVAMAWLRPGGSFVFVEARPVEGEAATAGPAGHLWAHPAAALGERLAAAGASAVEMAETRSAFVYGRAVRAA